MRAIISFKLQSLTNLRACAKFSFSRRRRAVIKFATRGQRCEKPARDVIPHTAAW